MCSIRIQPDDDEDDNRLLYDGTASDTRRSNNHHNMSNAVSFRCVSQYDGRAFL
jgi:hypothetical protein